ncbi:MAG: ribose-5-phosphate isomerase RpiA, partial [Myxococcota bacterium]
MSDANGIWAAAHAAASEVEPNDVVGLGTGRAAAMFVRALAARVEDGLRVKGVPTSIRTAELARELGVPLATLDDVSELALDVDGADEVDPNLDLIKGHGGALLRERVVASISKRFLILVGPDKIVPRLGALRSVPVEVAPFAAPVVARRLASLGAEVEMRERDGEPFESDNGNHILDARFATLDDPAALERDIDAVPGVVDSGLFIGMA